MTRFEDKPSNMPKSPYKEAFESGVETQTVLNYIYSGNYKPGLRQSLMLKLMRDVMQKPPAEHPAREDEHRLFAIRRPLLCRSTSG